MTKVNIDFSKVILLRQGGGLPDSEIAAMADEASNYISSFPWCEIVRDIYLGIGIPGVIGVFLVHITPNRTDVDEWLWVVAGDVPPAYLVTDQAPNPACALDAYIGEMEKWVEAASSGGSIDELIPVNVEPSPENAEALRSRLALLDSEVLSLYSDDLKGT